MDFPATLTEWEKLLCRSYLEVRGSGNLLPITSFEVTSHRLAQYAIDRTDDIAAKAALRAFKSAFTVDQIRFAYEDGYYASMRDLPGCFSYLALTLIVENALDDENEGWGQFRDKLSAFLGTDHQFVELGGIAELWRDLEKWLRKRAEAGGQYRLLQLPDAGTWVQIGYTKRLAFPAKRDIQFGRHLLHDRQEVLQHPLQLLSLFEKPVERRNTTAGLADAFRSFQSEYLRGNRALADHDFWRFAHLCRQEDGEYPDERKHAAIHAERNEDNRWSFAIKADGAGSHVRRSDRLSDLIDRDIKWILPASISQGYLVFIEIGYGQWKAVETIDDCRGKALLAVPRQFSTRIKIGAIQETGHWSITEQPISVGAIDLALAACGIRPSKLDALRPIALTNGVRSMGAWLGRKNFLPAIDGSEGSVVVRPMDGAQGVLDATPQDGKNRIALTTPNGVSGDFDIEVRLDPTDSTPIWSQRLTFVEDAYIHAGTGANHADWQQLDDWVGSASFGDAQLRPNELAWDSCAPADDLCEAVYARGQSLRPEGELAELARQAFGPKQNPWAILKLLQDSSIIRPKLRPQWKGREWEIMPPALRRAGSAAGAPIYIVDGAVGARLASAFKNVVEANGGQPFRRKPPGIAAATLGFAGGDKSKIAKRLEWPILDESPVAARITGGFATTPRRLKAPERTFWSWSSGHFRRRPDSSSDVSLECESHPEGRDHDIFKISGPAVAFATLSRTAAIAFGYGMAKKMAFNFRGEFLEAVDRQAKLPVEMALALRAKNLMNPWIDDNRFFYSASIGDARLLKGALGATIGLPTEQELPLTALNLKARLRRSTQRLTWTGSNFAVTPPIKN